MPKIYSDETLAMIWQAIDTEKKTLRRVANELSTTMQEVNKMYNAAAKRYKHGQKQQTTKPQQYRNTPTVKIQRPPAEYSNTSPYRIARPGLTR